MDQNAWTDFWSQSYIEFQNRKKKKEMSSVTLNFVIFVILTMCSFVKKKKGQISHESQQVQMTLKQNGDMSNTKKLQN